MADPEDISRSMSMATTAIGAIQPSRVSSEAPEVVPEQPQPPQHAEYSHGNGVLVSTYGDMDIKRGGKGAIGGSRHQKQVDHNQTETRNYMPPPTPSLRRFEWEPRPEAKKDDRKDEAVETEILGPAPGQKRQFTLYTTIALALVAFLLGGGIGGGVGGALFAQEKSKVQSSSPTATASSHPATATVFLDTAGCPLVNNSTYISANSSTPFLKLCGIEITSPAGQSIDLSNTARASFDACLDSCAGVRGCIGATWVIFDPTAPTRNSQCFLKSGIGVQTKGGANGDTACSGYLKSAIS